MCNEGFILDQQEVVRKIEWYTRTYISELEDGLFHDLNVLEGMEIAIL